MKAVQRLFDTLHYQQANYPQTRSFGHFREGAWQYFTTQAVITEADRLASGMLQLGIGKGTAVAIVTPQNTVEWVLIDIALQRIGAISVPVYPTISGKDYVYIFNDAGVQYCFAGSAELCEKVAAIKNQVPTLKAIYAFNETVGAFPHWNTLQTPSIDTQVQTRSEQLQTDDIATIIYTSGTTGFPKGVVLTHKNILSSVIGVGEVLPIVQGDRVLSFLPLCHIFERAALYAYMYYGMSVSFTGVDNIANDIKTVQPHFFTSVPRLLEKIYDKIYAKGLELTGLKRGLFFWALGLADSYEYDKAYSGIAALKVNLANKLIFSKWREALGGHMKGIIVGASPCPVKIARVFSFAGIPIREGYGLTEASPGIAITRFEKGGALLGTVGPAVAGVSIRIDSSDGAYAPGEGEVLAAGDNIMVGYYNKPDETAKTVKEIDGKRWLFTGDVGTLVKGPDGRDFLKITDRKKELLKTSNGKYVAPAPIESSLREHYLVDQAMVIGDNKKFVSALIVPAADALKEWCAKYNVPWTSMEEVIRNEKVIKRYYQLIERVNPLFSHTEQIKKLKLIAQPWEATKKDGSEAELTPTLKLKRRVILAKCAADIDTMYAEAE